MGTFDGLASGLFGGPNVNQPGAQINQAGAQAWQGNPGDANANQGAEQAAQGLELAQANGTGPSQAVEMLKAQTAAAQNNANAIASSGSGSSGQGIQRRNAMMAGAGATQALGGQAAAARAGEQQAGIQGLGNMANQARGLDLQASGINANQANMQAQLTEQQNINNQGVQSQQQGANAGTLGNLASAAASAAPLLMMSDRNAKVGIEAADADLQEPPNPHDPGDEAHISLREEPSVDGKPFLLTFDHQTGRAYKPLMQELSPEEERVAFERPHGAGEFGSPDRQRTEVHDFDLGKGLSKVQNTRYPAQSRRSDSATLDPAYKQMSDEGFQNMVQSTPLDQAGPYKEAAHRPGLNAATSYEDAIDGKQYAQGERGMPDTAAMTADKESQMGAVDGAQGDPRTNGDNSGRDWSRAEGLSYAQPDDSPSTQQPPQQAAPPKSRIAPWRAPDGSGNYDEGWDNAPKPEAPKDDTRVSDQLGKLSSAFGNFGSWGRPQQQQGNTIQAHDLDMSDSFEAAKNRMKSQHGTWPVVDPKKNWGRMDEVSPGKFIPWQETNQQDSTFAGTDDDIPTTDENSFSSGRWSDIPGDTSTWENNSPENPLILDDDEPVDEAPMDRKDITHQTVKTVKKVRGNATNADLDLGSSHSYADRVRGHIEGADVDLQPGATQNVREAKGASRITRDPQTGVQTGEPFDPQNPNDKPVEQGGPPEFLFGPDGKRWAFRNGTIEPVPDAPREPIGASRITKSPGGVQQAHPYNPATGGPVMPPPVSPPQQAAQQAATATKAVTGVVDQQVAAQMAQKAAQQAVAQSIQKVPNAAVAATLPRGTIQGSDIDLHSKGKKNVNGDAVNPEGIRPTGTDPGIAAITSDKMKKTEINKIGESTNHGGPRDTEANASRSTTDTGDRGGAQQAEAKRSYSTSGRRDGNTQHAPSKRDESSYGARPPRSDKHGDYYGAKNPSLANGAQNGSAWYEPLFKGDPPITRGGEPWGRPGTSEDRIHAADLDMGRYSDADFGDGVSGQHQSGGRGSYDYRYDPGISSDDSAMMNHEMQRGDREFKQHYADMDFSHAVGVREPVSMSRYRELPSLDDDNASIDGFDERMPLPRPSLREQSENGLSYLPSMRHEAMRAASPGPYVAPPPQREIGRELGELSAMKGDVMRGMEPGHNLQMAQRESKPNGLEMAHKAEPRAGLAMLQKKRLGMR